MNPALLTKTNNSQGNTSKSPLMSLDTISEALPTEIIQSDAQFSTVDRINTSEATKYDMRTYVKTE